MTKRFTILLLFALLFWAVTANALADAGRWQAAKNFIQQGDYAGALQEVEQRLAESPNDLVGLRLKANLLLSLKRDAEAIEALRTALRLDGQSVATKYYLGKALLYTGSLTEAIDLWQEVVQAAPGSMYARHARQLLPKLENSRTALRATQPKRFKAVLRTALEYDDNVPSREDGSSDRTSTDSFRQTVSAYLKYKLTSQNRKSWPFSSAISYSVYQSYHGRDAYGGYDVTSQSVGLNLDRTVQLAGKDVNFDLGLSASKVHLDHDSFSESAGVSLTAGIVLSERLFLKVGLDGVFSDYDDDTDHPNYYSRDGNVYSFFLSPYFYFSDNRYIVAPFYKYIEDDSDGGQFNGSSYELGVSGYAKVFSKTNLAVTLKYASREYEEFTPAPKRDDDVYAVSASLSRPLFGVDGLTGELSYNFRESRSNRDFADYDRSVYSLALAYEF